MIKHIKQRRTVFNTLTMKNEKKNTCHRCFFVNLARYVNEQISKGFQLKNICEVKVGEERTGTYLIFVHETFWED